MTYGDSEGCVRSGAGYYLWGITARERRGASFLFGEAFFAQNGGAHNFRLALTPVPREALAEGIRRIGEAIAR